MNFQEIVVLFQRDIPARHFASKVVSNFNLSAMKNYGENCGETEVKKSQVKMRYGKVETLTPKVLLPCHINAHSTKNLSFFVGEVLSPVMTITMPSPRTPT